MSQMLGSLKGILHKVQHDGNSQRQKLVKKLESTTKRIRKRLSTKQVIEGEDDTESELLLFDPDAGAGLLLSYQQSWVELRRNSSDCASEAVRVDDRLQTDFHHCQELHNSFTAFNMELLRIPDLLVILGEAKTRIEDVRGQLKNMEKELDMLEDVCYDLEVKDKKLHEAKTVEHYDRKKHKELEKLKAAALQEHSQQIKTQQLVQTAEVEDRRQAYQDVFVEQMEHYKTHGKVELPIGYSRTLSQDTPSLEEVSLNEVDLADLDEFLKELSPVSLEESHDRSFLSPASTPVDDDEETVPVLSVDAEPHNETTVASQGNERCVSPPVVDQKDSENGDVS